MGINTDKQNLPTANTDNGAVEHDSRTAEHDSGATEHEQQASQAGQKAPLCSETKLNIILPDRNTNRIKAKRLAAYMLIAAFVICAVAAQFVKFDDSGAFFERVLGVYAPSSGITRAFFCVLRLDFVGAFYYNQFFTLAMPFILYVFAAFIVNVFAAKKILPLKINRYVIIAAAVLFLLYGVLRNFDAFYFLRPQSVRF